MRERKNHSADFLVCFPSRAHLALTPKPICSPSRPNEPNNRLRNNNHHQHNPCRRLSRLSGGQASPMLWAKPSNLNSNLSNKQMDAEINSEPTSPKVTCAGQIKVRRPRSDGHNPCKNWQTVMEEIERIHKSRSRSRTFGFKKDVLNFLACLRNVKFDFRCFGGFPQADITTDDEAEEEEEEDEEIEVEEEEEEKSKTVFSKWFMVLQENQMNEENDDDDKKNFSKFGRRDEKQRSFDLDNSGEDDSSFVPAVPPANALLLMRCRSAPAKSWLENKIENEQENTNCKKGIEDEDKEQEKTEEKIKKKKKKKDLRSLMEEERLIQKENLVLMRYDADFYKLSADIAKETWVVGGIKNPLPRTLSLKRR